MSMFSFKSGSSIFSRGGGFGGPDFEKKIFENFVDHFFESNNLIFRALPKKTLFPPNYLRPFAYKSAPVFSRSNVSAINTLLMTLLRTIFSF